MDSYAPPVPTPHPAPEAHPPAACLNCGQPLHDQFCARCGQAAATHRITLGHWLHDIPHSIWHVDRGLPYTLKQMLRRPGATLRNYLAGQRAPYFRPLSYLLLITGLITLCYVVLRLRPYNVADPAVPPALRAVQERFLAFFSKYINWFAVLLLPLSAGVLRLFLRRARYNYAEYITIACFVTGTFHFFALLALPFLYLLNGTRGGQQLMMGVLLVSFGYKTWAYASLLEPFGLSTFGRYLRGLAATLSTYFITLAAALTILVLVNRKEFTALVRQKTAPAVAHPR
ncbi:DUF3667 domain-containing protein [Hymenobacter sp. BT175]|uniref:DUF3667 domain-containing protein n=1 Tax=Hymenobacter translucens TaxID=2886507 RepID=UPI001D0E1160|nr:DUF3667 domain-containing protein [Hymenobacter translucens]MCC2546736.1 DUF3667 domain-containing protein [Hymenobacter translucens]